MRRAFFAASFVAVFAASPAFAAGISVAMDEVRTISFGVPVATVYVGNPAIADINMIDAQHAFVIGKGFGSTNIVALNAAGDQVFDMRVSVLTNAGTGPSTLILNRGAQRVTYSCTEAHCVATPQPGDGKDSFDEVNAQLASHSDAARKAAGQ